MGYKIRIPLPGGVLKFKTIGRLRKDERGHRVPVKKVGDTYIVWRSHTKQPDNARAQPCEKAPVQRP